VFFRAARAITRKTIILKLRIILIIMIIMIIMLAILIQSPYYPDLLPCCGSASTEKQNSSLFTVRLCHYVTNGLSTVPFLII
jgi:hypothetical protein